MLEETNVSLDQISLEWFLVLFNVKRKISEMEETSKCNTTRYIKFFPEILKKYEKYEDTAGMDSLDRAMLCSYLLAPRQQLV